jgi:predicted transcriptional regulator
MLAIKINDPVIEKELADMAKQQHTSRQAIVRAMIAQQLENQVDYQAAVKAMKDTSAGIPLSDVMRRYGLEY